MKKYSIFPFLISFFCCCSSGKLSNFYKGSYILIYTQKDTEQTNKQEKIFVILTTVLMVVKWLAGAFQYEGCRITLD